jgi:hypothetical protein
VSIVPHMVATAMSLTITYGVGAWYRCSLPYLTCKVQGIVFYDCDGTSLVLSASSGIQSLETVAISPAVMAVSLCSVTTLLSKRLRAYRNPKPSGSQMCWWVLVRLTL